MKGNGSSIDIDMMVDAAAWREALPALKSLVDRTLLAVWRLAGDDSPAEASLVLSSDAEMRKLNFQHRAVDRSTNVLAFRSASRCNRTAGVISAISSSL